MTITVDAELGAAIRRQADRLGVTPEQFAVDLLRRRVVNADRPPAPGDPGQPPATGADRVGPASEHHPQQQ